MIIFLTRMKIYSIIPNEFQNFKAIEGIQDFFSHLNLKVFRMRSVKRRPRRWVLVLKSACSRSSVVGFGRDLPKSESIAPAKEPRNELVFVRNAISLRPIFVLRFSSWPGVVRRCGFRIQFFRIAGVERGFHSSNRNILLPLQSWLL